MLSFIIRKWKLWRLWREYNRVEETFKGFYTEVTLSDREFMKWVQRQMVVSLNSDYDIPDHILNKPHVQEQLAKYEELRSKYDVFLEGGMAV